MNSSKLSDTQNIKDQRGKAINEVGISDLRYPLTFEDSGQQMQVAGLYQMGVYLPNDQKGTHMSRFIQVLNENRSVPQNLVNFGDLVVQVSERLESPMARVKVDFTWFVEKSAPMSGSQSFMDYEVELIAKNSEAGLEKQINVIVPVKSLCPCSKSISDYGAHNQRSYITLCVRAKDGLRLIDLIQIAEKNSSAELFAVLKRSDEKYITERAYDHALFVEDTVRDIALAMDANPLITEYLIHSENIESIHNHSAFAILQSDGFEAI